MSNRRVSGIWYHYDKMGPNRAQCKYCKALLSTTGGSYGNLRRHLKTKHRTVPLVCGTISLGPEASSPDPLQLTEITFKTDAPSETYEDSPLDEEQMETYEDTFLNEPQSQITEKVTCGNKTTQLKDIADIIQHLDRIAKRPHEENEFEEFGRFVAAELRRIPRRKALLLQKEIQDSIFNVRMQTIE